MPIDDRTANRSYKLPNAGNFLADDVVRLRDALNAIDADVFARYTKTEVDQLISNLIAGAPGALDTLDELAAALGDDANFASTVTIALANRYTKAESDARYVQGVTQTENIFTGNGSQIAFTLTQTPPTRESLLVTVDGVVQPTSEYNLSGATLTLSEAPANGAKIRVLMLGVAGPVQSASTLSFTQAGTGAVTRTVDSKLKDFISVKDFGAVGNGTTDDTAAIQAAFNSSGNDPIYFPPGIYRVTGTGAACLTLSRERIIFGAGRASRIRADSAGASTNLLNVAITTANGFSDCRHLAIRDLYFSHNGGGNHCIYFAPPGSGVLYLLTALISNCTFFATSGKYSIYVDQNFAHSRIDGCVFNNAYLDCLDANVISKCNVFGTGVGIIFNITAYGVRNNIVRDCTITNRDGAIVVSRGDNIRIVNNQLEVALGYTPSQNQSTPSAMVYLAGTPTYNVVNTVIQNNNFGGGTNVSYLIYIDRAQRTLISGNNFIASNIDDIYFANVSQDNILATDNLTQGTVSNPRTRTYFKTQTNDLGLGNMGVLQLASRLNPQAGWTAPRFFKDVHGFVRFDGAFSGGSTSAGAILGILPGRFRPPADTTVLVSTDSGVGQVNISSLGIITSKSLPSNVNVLLSPFQADKMEGYDKIA